MPPSRVRLVSRLPEVAALLALGWLGWAVAGHAPMGPSLGAAVTVLLAARLVAQWRTPREDASAASWARRLSLRGRPSFPGGPLGFEALVFVLASAGLLYLVLRGAPAGAPADAAGYAGYAPLEALFPRASALGEGLSWLHGVHAAGVARAAGLLFALLLLLGALRSLDGVSRRIAGLLAIPAFAAAGYAACLGSAGAESAGLVSLVLGVAFALRYVLSPGGGLGWLAAYFAAVLLFGATEPPHAPVAVVLVSLGVLLSRRSLGGASGGWIPAGMAATALVLSVWVASVGLHAMQPALQAEAASQEPGIVLLADEAPVREPASVETTSGEGSPFVAWEALRGALLAGSPAGLALGFCALAWVGVMVRRRSGTPQGRLLAEMFLGVLVAAASLLLWAGLSGGQVDPAAHLLVDVVLISAAAYLARWWSGVVG